MMFTTPLLLALVAFTSLLYTVEAESDVSLTIDNYKCANPWTITSFSYDCNDGMCNFGEKVHVTGTLNVGSEFTTEEVEVVLKITMFGFQIAQTTQDICAMISSESVECGQPSSDYTFDTEVDIPTENALTNVLMSMTGNYVTVKATIGDITTCSARVNKVQSGGSMSMAVASSILVGTLLVGAGMYGVHRRRRIIRDESLKKTLTDFEMVPDPVSRVVQV